MIISIIVAMDEKGAIGRDNRLPWHLSDDLKRFKATTIGHHIIMGRKTYESIGRLLPGRKTVIVTRQANYKIAGAIVTHSLEEAIAACNGDDEIFVIGGTEIFREALPIADRIYATEIHADFAGDVFFPEWGKRQWIEIERTSYRDGQNHDFVVYDSDRLRGTIEEERMMSKVKMESRVPTTADNLWKTIGGFDSLGDWHPAIAKCEATGDKKGSTRTLSLAGGGKIEERMEDSSENERLCRYTILSGPLPVANYIAEIRVRDNGDGTSTVEWSSEFEPTGNESEAVKTIQGIYQAGFDNLKKMFGS